MITHKGYRRFRHQRLQRLVFLFIAVAGIVLIILGILRENIVFFMTPGEYVTQRFEHRLKPQQFIRLGGKVLINSIQKQGQHLSFKLADEKEAITILYQGPIPDLFREGQGVVVEGTFNPAQSEFKATKLFAKHDENYIPREVVNDLKQKKMWRNPL